MTASGFESNPGGVDGWEYEGGQDGGAGTMIQDMAEMVGVINDRWSGILRSSHLDGIDAQIVAIALEDAYDHLRAPCNADMLKKIIKMLENDQEQAAMVEMPATLRFAIIRCDASMSGSAFDYILQMFVKQLRPIPHLARPDQVVSDEEEEDDDEDEASSGFWKPKRQEE